MRVRRTRKPLPRSFRGHPDGKKIIFEKDLRIGTSKLRCKLVVFDNRKDLRDFWSNALHPKGQTAKLGNCCDGIVHPLFTERYLVDKKGQTSKHEMCVDPRYYAIMAIIKSKMGSAEVTSHEAVHAGFAYARRIKRTPWDEHIIRNDEEAVAYPAGVINSELARIYWKHFSK